MGYIVLLIIAYIAGHGVYLYNNDAKIKAKCKGKSLGDMLLIITAQVWENHKFWYKDSNLEDIVEDVKHDGVKVVAQAKEAVKDAVTEIKSEATEVIAQAKEKVEKITSESKLQKSKTSATKTPKKSENKSTSKPTTKGSKDKAPTKKK